MKKSISFTCPQCKHYQTIEIHQNKNIPLICAKCAHQTGAVEDIDKVFERCPVCPGRQFYLTKDFNQLIGCLIMLVGIILVPWTYGLSLPVFALIDWLLARKVPSVIVCYRCATEFRGFSPLKTFKTFMHHIGLKYDKFR